MNKFFKITIFLLTLAANINNAMAGFDNNICNDITTEITRYISGNNTIDDLSKSLNPFDDAISTVVFYNKNDKQLDQDIKTILDETLDPLKDKMSHVIISKYNNGEISLDKADLFKDEIVVGYDDHAIARSPFAKMMERLIDIIRNLKDNPIQLALRKKVIEKFENLGVNFSELQKLGLDPSKVKVTLVVRRK